MLENRKICGGDMYLASVLDLMYPLVTWDKSLDYVQSELL